MNERGKSYEFHEPFLSMQEFEQSLLQGDLSRHLYLYNEANRDLNVALANEEKGFLKGVRSDLREGEWRIQFEDLDVFQHFFQTHGVVNGILFEVYPKPDGVILVSNEAGARFRFPVVRIEGEYFRCSGRIIKALDEPNNLIGVNLWLSSEERDEVAVTWRYSIEGVPVARYFKHETNVTGGASDFGDGFKEIVVHGDVDIDYVSVFTAYLDREGGEEVEVEVKVDEGRVRIVPKGE